MTSPADLAADRASDFPMYPFDGASAEKPGGAPATNADRASEAEASNGGRCQSVRIAPDRRTNYMKGIDLNEDGNLDVASANDAGRIGDSRTRPVQDVRAAVEQEVLGAITIHVSDHHGVATARLGELLRRLKTTGYRARAVSTRARHAVPDRCCAIYGRKYCASPMF